MSDIILQPAQQKWFNRIASNIFPAHHCYVDTSETGKGKTIVALALAKHYGIPLFVVGPATLAGQWRDTAALYGVEVVEYISYQSLRATKQKWVTRKPDDKGYTATSQLRDICAAGAFFVFDEWQNSANLTAQYYAALAVSTTALEHCASYCALLSATPMVRDSQVRQMLHFCNILKQTRLTRTGRGGIITMLGYQELLDFRRKARAENRAVGEMPFGYRKEMLVPYYTDVVKPFMVGGIVDNVKKTTSLHTANLHCTVSPATEPLLQSAVAALSSEAEYDPETHGRRSTGIKGEMASMLKEVHKHMSEIFVGRALEVLDQPNTKVVIFTRFSSHLHLLREMLEDVTGVLVLDGSVPAKKRGPVVDDFTSERMDSRVLLTQIKVGGVGINMQSRHPGMIIHGFCVPDWSFVDIEQAAGRIYRPPYLNDAHFSVVYPVTFELKAILRAIANASERAKRFVDADVSARKVPIADYPATYFV